MAIDLFCGLGGWTEGLLAEDYDVVGFDIEQHVYGDHRYPAQLVVQDVLTLHGSQFKSATLIVASPPCQEYSYMAMPWSKAKALAADYRSGSRDVKDLTALFDACFRIQREACQASGRHIPLVVENVRGAVPWVGRARWNFGSFYLWGDVPALMPIALKASKVPGFRFDGSGGSFQTASVEATGVKAPGMNWSDPAKRGQDFTRLAGRHALEGIKSRDTDGYERSHPNAFGWKAPRTTSRGKARKFASAMIAKIPLPLSRHIAATYRQAGTRAAA
ncbi:DNA cytosine methyltransferase [Reyranella sp.]|uniref:DNA cytosine methyltransferase n=1 Tax=Reyranella sp. TaxID=1929291 RepID=UPI0025E99EE9|nr:DNA cytosine methyltransferase [Reyranella sp.]